MAIVVVHLCLIDPRDHEVALVGMGLRDVSVYQVMGLVGG